MTHPTSEQPQTFVYGFMTLRCTATLDAQRVQIKQGLRTLEAPVASLRHLYLQPSRSGTEVTLLLGHERSFGRKRILRLPANPGDPGLLALVDAILARCPDIDRRGLDEKTALRMMGAVQPNPVLLAAMVLLVPGLVGLALLPKLIHGVDFGEERVSITALAKGKIPVSRNLVIIGAHARMQESVEVTATTGGSRADSATSYFVPLVPEGWDKTRPVHVILETDELSAGDESKLERTTKFRGVLRDVLWEGLDEEERGFFRSEVGLSLADDVRLVEYRANPRFDLLVFVGATGVTFLIVLSIAAGLWLERRRTDPAGEEVGKPTRK